MEFKTYKLGDIGCITTGKTPPSNIKDAFGEDGVPFVTPKDMIGNKWITKTERYLSTNGIKPVQRYLVNSNSVAVSCIGSDMGKAVLLKFKSVTNQQINTIEVGDEHSYNYVYYVLSTMQDYLKSISGGSATPILNKFDFSNIEIQLPSLENQKKIADFLSVLDDKIHLNHQINHTLEQMAQLIFKSWFVDFDPVRAKAAALAMGADEKTAIQEAMATISGKSQEQLQSLQDTHPDDYQRLYDTAKAFPCEMVDGVPLGWEIKKVGDVARFVKGKKPKIVSKQKEANFLPHILVGNLSGNYNEYAKIDNLTVSQIKDTIISMDGSAGRISIGHNGIVGSTLAKMVLDDEKYWALFYSFLKEKERDIQENTTGTSVPHTDKSRVTNYNFIIPSDCLIELFTNIFERNQDCILNNRRETKNLENTRDSILPKLLSGDFNIE